MRVSALDVPERVEVFDLFYESAQIFVDHNRLQ
jgi:hypothetical protein